MKPMQPKKPLLPTEIVTLPVRLSFPALFDPKPTTKGGAKLAWQAALLLPPDMNLAPFAEAIKAAMVNKFAKVVPFTANSPSPIKSTEGSPYSGYDPGWRVLNVKNDRQPPGLVDARGVPVTDRNKFYPGCWVSAFVNAYAWEFSGKKGVSFGLNALQFVRDDERLDNRKTAQDVFEALELADENSTGDGGDAGDPLAGLF